MPERTPSEEELELRKQVAAAGAQMHVHNWGDHSQFWSAEVYRDEEKLGDTGTYKSAGAALRRAVKIAEKKPKQEPD